MFLSHFFLASSRSRILQRHPPSRFKQIQHGFDVENYKDGFRIPSFGDRVKDVRGKLTSAVQQLRKEKGRGGKKKLGRVYDDDDDDDGYDDEDDMLIPATGVPVRDFRGGSKTAAVLANGVMYKKGTRANEVLSGTGTSGTVTMASVNINSTMSLEVIANTLFHFSTSEALSQDNILHMADRLDSVLKEKKVAITTIDFLTGIGEEHINSQFKEGQSFSSMASCMAAYLSSPEAFCDDDSVATPSASLKTMVRSPHFHTLTHDHSIHSPPPSPPSGTLPWCVFLDPNLRPFWEKQSIPV